uniref:LRAT domain-containing protein n=1 Tax=Sphaeramia orbicularis TaxID=375764 RepID=A0A673A1P2_9TELE
MKNLILAALILQLVITVIEVNGYAFGDIVGFQRFCGNRRSFMHFGIYVGNEPFDGKNNGEDVFHITGPARNLKLSICTFGKMSEMEAGEPAIVFNFLDSEGYTPGTKQEIRDRIINNLNQENCERWNPAKNNCEHLATYVRYGEKVSLQICQDLKFIPKNKTKFSEETRKKLEILFSEAVATACSGNSKKGGS